MMFICSTEAGACIVDATTGKEARLKVEMALIAQVGEENLPIIHDGLPMSNDVYLVDFHNWEIKKIPE